MAKSGGKIIVTDDGSDSIKVVGIDQGFPYPFPGAQGAELMVAPGGACDPAQGQLKSRLSPFRHAAACFIGVVSAPGADIVIAKGQSVVLFANGNAGATTGLTTGTLSLADTNAENDGGVAKGTSVFVTQGVGVSPMEPWLAAAGKEPNDDVNMPQWLRDEDTDYGGAATRALFDACSVEITNGDDACVYDMGPMSLWAQLAGVSKVRNGLGGLGGSIWWMATPQVSASSKSSEELTVTVTLEKPITIPSSALAPTEAGQVVIPFRYVLLGYPQCPSSPMESAMVRRMAELEKKLAAMGNG